PHRPTQWHCPIRFCSICCPLAPCLRRNKAQGRFDLAFFGQRLAFFGNQAGRSCVICALGTGIQGFTTSISTPVGGTFKINNGTGNHSGSAVVQANPFVDSTTGLVDAGNWSVTDPAAPTRTLMIGPSNTPVVTTWRH